jgi:hypothetical protein
MARTAYSTTWFRPVLHWLFPSRRALLVLAAAEIAAFAIAMPPAAHMAIAALLHVGAAVWRR